MNSDEPQAHVLVVDDEDDLCVLIAMRLEHHGYAVSTEGTMRGALELLCGHASPDSTLCICLRVLREDEY